MLTIEEITQHFPDAEFHTSYNSSETLVAEWCRNYSRLGVGFKEDPEKSFFYFFNILEDKNTFVCQGKLKDLDLNFIKYRFRFAK